MNNSNHPGSPFAFKETEVSRFSFGLTKRELFAAIAMQGLLASQTEDSPEEFAEGAVVCADALIAALEA